MRVMRVLICTMPLSMLRERWLTMPDEIIFAAMADHVRITRHSERGNRRDRRTTTYSINILGDGEKPLCGAVLTRNHLVALHYALAVELSETAHERHSERRSLLDDIESDYGK